MTSNSQTWLSGADNSLDNFFRSGPSSRGLALKVTAATTGIASGRGSTSNNVGRRSPHSRLKRKRVTLEERLSAVGGSPAKKSKLPSSSRVKANGSSHPENLPLNRELASPSKESRAQIGWKGRRALGDVTRTLQNSPHRRGTASFRPSSRLKNGKDSNWKDAGAGGEESPSDTELIDNDVPPRLRAACPAKTPHHSLKAANGAKEPLLTPPSSSLPLNRALFMTQRDSPTSTELDSQRKGSNSKKTVVQTPSALSATSEKKSYPTPTSIAAPRFRFASKSAKNPPSPFPVSNFQPDPADLALTSSISSPPDCPQTDDHVNKENEDLIVLNVYTSNHEDKADCKRNRECSGDFGKGKTKDQDKIYAVIPSSQTQYIHYSPTKQRAYDVPVQMSILRRKLFEPSTVIPCSQPLTTSPSSSQVACLSPRKARKPVPIVTPKGTGVALNFVVPTSQEDEQEIRISEEDVMSRSHQTMKVGNCGPGNDGKSRSEDNDNFDPKQELQPEGQTKSANSTTESKQNISNRDQAAQFRILDRMLDDLQRLAKKAEKGILTPSQVLSRPRVPLNSPRRRSDEPDKDCKKDENEIQYEFDQDVKTRNWLLMQSSITEPDESQCDEDPFSITNEAYTKHIGLNRKTASRSRSLSKGTDVEPLIGRGKDNAVRVSTSSDTYTQSTDTQPDEDDEDPFPDLPPLPPPPPPSATAPPSTWTSTSTIDRTTVETLLRTKSRRNHVHEQSSQTEPESETETESESESESEMQGDSQRLSETQSDSQEGLFPSLPPSMFDTELRNSCVDEDEGEDEGETISTLDVRRILGMDDNTNTDTDTTPPRHVVSRFRRRDGRGDEEEESVDGEDSEETIPTAVREFLSMFPQSQG